LELARTRFNDYSPLIRLKRYPEAQALLQACRRSFEQAEDWPDLGKVLAALADLENTLSKPAAAVPLAQAALRYTYLAGEPEDCAVSHFILAKRLPRN